MESGERGSGIAGGSPEAFGLDSQEGEENGEDGEGKVFDAPEVGGFGASACEEADKEDEMREGEEGESDPEIEEEMVVECGAVGAGITWKEPGWGEQERGVMCEARLAGERHTSRISRLRAGYPDGASRAFL